jgi:hypothetical protein
MKLKIKKYDEYDFRTKPALEHSLWKDDQLNVEVRDALFKIAEEFIEFLKLGLDIESAKDIQITGSLANYNYTKYSDLDLHILLDFDEIDENSILVKEYLMSKKVIWNNSYSIKVKNWEVEVYPQDVKEEHHSTGIYSILNNQWIKEPEVPKNLWTGMRLSDIKKKVKEIKYEIENIETSEDPEGVISRLKDKIKNMRRAGLEQDGEYSIENLTFKALRRLGDVDKLYSLGKKEYEKSLSLNGGCVTQEQLYEDVVGILQEDTEWWKKRRPTDKKNLRALIGDIPAAKGKHTKSGAPFTNDPPSYPGNKLGPGLGLLEEEIQEEDFINNLKNSKPGDSLSFSVLQIVKGGPLDMFDVFVPGKQYLAVITSDNKINFKNTEKGSQTQAKEEVIQKLSSKGPVCKTIDCGSAQMTGLDRAVTPKQTQAGTTKKPSTISKDMPISDDKQKDIAQKLSKKYIPGASEGTLDKIGDWFSNNPYVKTFQELLSSLWDFFKNAFAGLGFGAALGKTGEKQAEKKGKKEISSGVDITDGIGRTKIGRVDGARAVFLPDQTRIGGTRAWRNNNPGNIRFSRYWKRWGALGREKARGGFAIFPNEQAGHDALEKYIVTYGFNSDKYTIKTFIDMYCKNCKRYPHMVATKLGADINTKMSTFKNNQRALKLFAKTIKGIEGWKAGTIDVAYAYEKAYA